MNVRRYIREVGRPAMGVVICLTFGAAALAQDVSPTANDPALGELPDYGSALIRMLIVLAIMVGALLVLAKFLPRWLNARGLPDKGQTHMKVIDRLQLEPRRSLYLVEMGGQVYFLGSSETGVALLREEPIDAASLNEVDLEGAADQDVVPSRKPSSPRGAEDFGGLLASKRT